MGSYVLPTLLLGSRGENVRKLQGYLRLLGFSLAQDSIFGPETRQAVINFQAQAGVAPLDGIVGPRTWAAIEANLGYSVDIRQESPPIIPEVGGPPTEPFFTPGKILAGGLLLAGVAGLLFGKRSKR